MYLSFGRAYRPTVTVASYTTAGMKRETYDRIVYEPVTIDPISIKITQFGRVKSGIKQYNWTKPDGVYGPYGITYQNEETLYDLVDMETGWTIARLFRNQLKESVDLFIELQMRYTDNGKYVYPSGELQSKLRYEMRVPLE